MSDIHAPEFNELQPPVADPFASPAVPTPPPPGWPPPGAWAAPVPPPPPGALPKSRKGTSYSDTSTGSDDMAELQETLVVSACRDMLSKSYDGVTIRTAIARGILTRSDAAEAFTIGYFQDGDAYGYDMTRSEVKAACIRGLGGY